jgi:hypothetical protein
MCVSNFWLRHFAWNWNQKLGILEIPTQLLIIVLFRTCSIIKKLASSYQTEFNFNGEITEASVGSIVSSLRNILARDLLRQKSEGRFCCGVLCCENLSIHAEIIPIKCLHWETLQRINTSIAVSYIVYQFFSYFLNYLPIPFSCAFLCPKTIGKRRKQFSSAKIEWRNHFR